MAACRYGISLGVFKLISHERAQGTSEISRRQISYHCTHTHVLFPISAICAGRNKLEEKSLNPTDLGEAAV